MPFPWKKKKKNRVTRISQIVADLQSPKRGGSLVVETGFPTSLIDLFVKNRSRFTKPKKPLQPRVSDLPPPVEISPAAPPLTETLNSSDITVVSAEAPSVTPLDAVKVGGVSCSGPDVNLISQCHGGSGSKSVLVPFLKMFVVVLLIASVDKLTVGITMSAFALLLLEYARERVVSCLRPCSYVNMRIIEPLTNRVFDSLWFRNLRLKTKKDSGDSESEKIAIDECSTNSLSFDEIEDVETKNLVSVCCEETSFVVGAELPECVNGDRKLDCPEISQVSNEKIEDSCEISQCVSKGNRKVWFKSMMVKKLVPKKLRTSKKEKRESERKSEENKAEGQGDVNESSSKIERECIREDGDDHGITCVQESSVAMVDEVAVIGEDDRVGNSGYISVLFIAALAGLVLGRLPALVLTMTWCVMLKILATSQAKSQNVPPTSFMGSSPIYAHV